MGHTEKGRPPYPRLMGIVNVTPDSFSDGGQYLGSSSAIERGLELIAEGADMLDIGGESTRPGASDVEPAEELDRVLPVIAELARTCEVPISIDTRHACVAAAALDGGASIVNDISAGLHDPQMLETVAQKGASFVAMHCRGEPATMQDSPRYTDAVSEIRAALKARLQACLQAGMARSKIILDPGIGFGKELDHNLEILRRLPELATLGQPLLLGVSRKSFISQACRRMPGAPDNPPSERLGGTAAAVAACVLGGASILRVHDVAIMKEACALAHALTPLSTP
ncbi:MAG: dihydropteroate synthase [Planctomycetota bacterium]|nr:dihydropteroate synthase [Planctomycetota bacterium]MDP6518432.1 dihydropteroate synthase [Planctomycetota bacterium]MDP6837704.1 dihydropteroate synthase [Planctomycetota bacterium]MDP6955829.1 dihydropteroate synthase [Planctomycetota bacterium]